VLVELRSREGRRQAHAQSRGDEAHHARWPPATARGTTLSAIERLNRELHRRTRVAMLFPNEASLLRLASAMDTKISEELEPGRM
jgi:Transposase, Mutator family